MMKDGPRPYFEGMSVYQGFRLGATCRAGVKKARNDTVAQPEISESQDVPSSFEDKLQC